MKSQKDWTFYLSLGFFCAYGALAIYTWRCVDDGTLPFDSRSGSHVRKASEPPFDRPSFDAASTFYDDFEPETPAEYVDISPHRIELAPEASELGNVRPLQITPVPTLAKRPVAEVPPNDLRVPFVELERSSVHAESSSELIANTMDSLYPHVSVSLNATVDAHVRENEGGNEISRAVVLQEQPMLQATLDEPLPEPAIEIVQHHEDETSSRRSDIPAIQISNRTAGDIAVAILDNSTKRATLPTTLGSSERRLDNQRNAPVPTMTPVENHRMLPSISLSITDHHDGVPVLRVPVIQESEVAATQQESDWPVAKKLHEEMAAMEQGTTTQTWISNTNQALDRLRLATFIESEESYAALLLLEGLVDELDNRANQTVSLVERSELERVSYSLRRRLSVWIAAHESARMKADTESDSVRALGDVTRALANVGRNLQQIGAQEWIEYLLVEEGVQAFDPTNEVSPEHNELAKRMIGRLNSHALSDAQVEFLNGQLFQEVRTSLSFWLKKSITIPRLLQLVEWYEQFPSDVLASQIAEQIDVLFNIEDPAWIALATQLDTHYRNANVRFAISKELINRMIPSTPPVDERVRDNVLGATVSGTSQIWNSLQIRTIPDEQRLVLGLQADGIVRSRTRASISGFVFYDKGVARFTSEKRIAIDTHGIQISPATARASSQQQMVDLTSQYDSVPVIGNLARRIAMQQRGEQEAEARREVERKIGVRARTRFDREFVTYLSDASDEFEGRLIKPLQSLSLRPTPVQLSSTESRCIVRYRLAGGEQMGASTPRPLALSNSVFSTQVHRSAVNNFIGQLDLNSRQFTLIELHEHLNEKLAQTQIRLPEHEAEEEVIVKFASRDSIAIDFENDELILKLRIAELQIQGGKRRRNFEASIHFIPRVNGIEVSLVRNPDQPIELDSKRLTFGDRVALLGVLNKVFSKNKPVSLTPADLLDDPRTQGLFVSQLVSHDGWIGVSISAVPNAWVDDTSREASLRAVPRQIR